MELLLRFVFWLISISGIYGLESRLMFCFLLHKEIVTCTTTWAHVFIGTNTLVQFTDAHMHH